MEFFDSQFPGNLSVAEKLYAAIDGEGVVGFTGAGTSMPAMPSWTALTTTLVEDAKDSGVMDSTVASSLLVDQSDLLYAIDEVYAAAGKSQTKVKVASIFQSLKEATEAHRLMMGSQIKKFITLNYDLGLEMSYSELYSRHLPSITFKSSQEFNAWVLRGKDNHFPPIMHWHGICEDSESIVLSGSDYSEFYDSKQNNRDILRSLFEKERCLLVGFGFTDPFITNQFNAVMQRLPSENRHFAIIGVKPSTDFNCQLERRKFQTKFKTEVIFYPVSFDDPNPHKELISILKQFSEKRPRKYDVKQNNNLFTDGNFNKIENDVIGSYRSDLFEIDGRSVYCEPKLWLGGPASKIQIWTSTISTSRANYIISAPSEYGLTTLGKRIASEILTSGGSVLISNAEDIPNYRKKLLQDSRFVSLNSLSNPTIIFDNFSFISHRRALKEFKAAFPNVRIIVLIKSSFSEDLVNEDISELVFEQVSLLGLSRSDIRSVVQVLSPYASTDMCSSAVDRIYDDLLQLCIPLTPSNVIMYASVLCKNGDFTPVSRLHIVERFVADALQRASDAFSESFSYINKVELFSDFCYNMFESQKINFDISDWKSFCIKYKSEQLVDFNHMDIMSDLMGGHILTKEGNVFYFRYRMFFSYFVGRKIASDISLLDACLEQDRHFELDGLIDVICSTMPNCDKVLQNIEKKLRDSLSEFYKKYPIAGVNVHENRKWEIGNNEENIWEKVAEKIEAGPASTTELDELKTSLASEQRTLDQKVSIIKFITSEKTVSRLAETLRTALENARNMSAVVKISSIDTVIKSYSLAYEVATIFAPLIAERKYVSWNGFTYINLIENDTQGTSEHEKDRMVNLVFQALPTSIAKNIANNFGSRKLGAAFLEICKNRDKDKVYQLLGLALLLRSKPPGWLEVCTGMLAALKKDDIFMMFALSLTMNQLRNETNTAPEVQTLKQFVASIRLRRDANLKSPNKNQIAKAVKTLDEKEVFKNN
ncbi:DUF4062 domain-containing protein [Acetobacter orientalis]|uniref:DUF4062 domain-containing protein n=1 Tax=Acetobacter orientalis TaxID=146474 RepID=A0A2Z5ZL49_9PROT|nr:DUF4062 domain-containing protein [Acetobacter orientalis]